MAELKTKLNDASVEDFLNKVEDDQKRKDEERLESLLLEALEGGGSQEITPEFFDQLRARARKARMPRGSCPRPPCTRAPRRLASVGHLRSH
mgnify:CR=1 FL=1